MTLEEGLVAILAVAAAILLFVGLAQALEARRVRAVIRPRRQSSARATPAASRMSPPDQPLAIEASPAAAPAPLPPPPPPDPALDALERALAFEQEGLHSHVIEAAVPHLMAGESAEGAEPSFTRAALWTLVGVARHGLGDFDGAQGAFDAAVHAAPDGASEGCPELVIAAAARSARRLLAVAEAMSATSGERVVVLRMAVLWLEWRIAAAPVTEEVAGLLDRAREALWDGYALASRALMRQRQFSQAREFARQALNSQDLPAAHRAQLAEVAAQCVVRQIARLVATARGIETTEAAALDALERARELLATSPVDAVTPGRWHAANRRIWNGYMQRGRRDIAAFELEAALRPLLSALHLRDLDLGLERKTREVVVRTIERISDGAGERVDRLLEGGDRDAAMRRWQDVRGIIQNARDQGLSHEELAHAFGRSQQMLERIEATKG